MILVGLGIAMAISGLLYRHYITRGGWGSIGVTVGVLLFMLAQFLLNVETDRFNRNLYADNLILKSQNRSLRDRLAETLRLRRGGDSDG